MVNTEAVLRHTVLPVTVVLAPVWPRVNALAYLLTVDVFSFVLFAITPGENSPAVHLAILPLSIVLTAVRPLVDALAVEIVLEELTSVGRAISPD